MSLKIKLLSKLPGDEAVNGLDAFAESLAENPRPLFVAGWIDCQEVSLKYEGGSLVAEVPKVFVRRIEVLGDDVKSVPKAVQDAVLEAERQRTGRTPLPFGELTAGYVEDDAESPNA